MQSFSNTNGTFAEKGNAEDISRVSLQRPWRASEMRIPSSPFSLLMGRSRLWRETLRLSFKDTYPQGLAPLSGATHQKWES
jgi:hypothetical protein